MPIERDITFTRAGYKFLYRTAGICIHAGQLLLQKIDTDDMLFTPGGRIHLGETGEEALCREMREELNSEVKVGRLIWVAENFFKMDGLDWQEIGLYYLMTLPEKTHSKIMTELPGEDSQGKQILLKNHWVGLGQLGQINLVPSFLKDALLNIPETTLHIVHRDR